ncbi:DUF2461 domain-containing protein [Clostridium intestinale]|jgi:uncharacterized protein (TIGR02453 family)|uniref:DUF2461 domain-containing protein n=1 Tax=Clostridium intestinale TaxID=36845 RepID=A0A7D6VPL4_9CLOT|nr:DUF2461 domain-containing protein [Clostridium intestinale]QLY78828.1 DUF2461 domain-containing protein [Clostridium intestinale]
MSTIGERSFEGFSNETIDFLKNLKENNNKLWFEENKKKYINNLLTPMKYLVMDLSSFILSIDPLLEVTPSSGYTISKIYRDTRFSKDKSPYKISMWITFKRRSKEWSSNPAFFFELSPDSYRYGMGFFQATPTTMKIFRENIDASLDKFKNAISFYSKQDVFVVEGDKYKRILDKEKTEDINEWYQRKNLYLVCNKEIDNLLFSKELVDKLIADFSLVKDFYTYLNQLKN